MTTKITFHSYKGGAGRSTGVTNAAYGLAREGYEVGVIDLDIEAAGLTTIFDPGNDLNYEPVSKYIKSKQESQNPQINEYAITDTLEWQKKSKAGREAYFDPEGGYPYGEEQEKRLDESGGKIHLLLAETEPDQLGEIPSEMRLISIFGNLLDDFEQIPEDGTLDYILIDGRSGIGGLVVPAVVHADKIVEFFRWSEQHKQGLREAVRWLDDYLETAGTGGEIYPVASSVPLNDEELERMGREIDPEDITRWLRNTTKFLGERPLMEEGRVETATIVPENSLLKIDEQIIIDSDEDMVDLDESQPWTTVDDVDIRMTESAGAGYLALADSLIDGSAIKEA